MINALSKRLPPDKSKLFHHCVAKLLYVALRCRLDILLAISFLCTRVTVSTEEDWCKLKRLIRYLHGTVDRKLTIGAHDLSIMDVFVDASYAVHPNMRSHTGGCIFFGRGALMSKSVKQSLNTTSSTVSELVGCSDYIPSAMYANLFLKAQGYEISMSNLHQDNQSTIQLLKNGRASCSKKTRHIDIRYFFMKDKVDKKEFTVKYCPTEQMVADFYTKPTQGSLFKLLSSVIMGEITLEEFRNVSSAKERVKNCEQSALDNKNTRANTQLPKNDCSNTQLPENGCENNVTQRERHEQKVPTYAEVTQKDTK